MDLSRALADIAEIQAQMAKGEIYRGYRPLPIAASGLIGLAAAWMQRPELGAGDPVGFTFYWIGVAVFAGFVGASEIIFNYAVHEGDAARRQTRRVVGQFLPSALAGAIVTACFLRLSTSFVPLLPGLWAICFGLGTFASRPYLPRGAMFVACFYYAAGVWLLWSAPETALSGWWVGGTFGIGQLIAAGVLYADQRSSGIGSRESGFGGREAENKVLNEEEKD